MKLTKLLLTTAAAWAAAPAAVLAQEAGVNASTDSVFIFNSLLFLIGGFLGVLDGRWLCHARGWPRTRQERDHAADQKHGSLFTRRAFLLF